MWNDRFNIAVYSHETMSYSLPRVFVLRFLKVRKVIACLRREMLFKLSAYEDKKNV